MARERIIASYSVDVAPFISFTSSTFRKFLIVKRACQNWTKAEMDKFVFCCMCHCVRTCTLSLKLLSLIVTIPFSFCFSPPLSHTYTRLLTHMHLPWVPISMHPSMGALYSSSYIIQIWIRVCQLADDSAPKFNGLDKNSLDSTLLWFSEFLWHTGRQM